MKTKKEHYLSWAAATKSSKSEAVLSFSYQPTSTPQLEGTPVLLKTFHAPKAASSPSLRAMGSYMEDVKMGVLRCGI